MIKTLKYTILSSKVCYYLLLSFLTFDFKKIINFFTVFIIEAIPLQHLPKNVSQVLTYYYKEPIEKGSVIEVSIQTKKLLALVVSTTPLENLKGDLKATDYTLKKINKIVSIPIVDKSFWEISKFISSYYFDDLTRVVKILLPNNLKSLIKYLGKPNADHIEPISLVENDNLIKLFEPSLYQNIIDTFNQQKSILLAFATEADLNFYLNHFEQVFDKSNFVVLGKKITIKNLNLWYRQMLIGHPKIIFGLRKTLGFPLHNLGLIYIFNSRDDSYKSWDLRPYFNYETTLNWFANLKNIPIYFQKNELDLSFNKQLDYQVNTFDIITPKHNPKVEIIVNRTFNKKDMLGISLKEDLLKHINSKEKWVLFLNKKGFWSGVKCQNCKTLLYCPNCHKPLTYYKTQKENYLKCSLCGQTLPVITTCPKCQSPNFEASDLGIDKLEQTLLHLLKDKHIPIFNTNTETANEEIDKLIDKFLTSQNGVLIGTSVILKSKVQNIENVAIVNIDNLFSIPDFHTEEKILNTLLKAKNIATKKFYIKTSYNQNTLFAMVKNNDFDKFWATELKLREKYNFPPYSQIILIEHRDINQDNAQKTLELYYEKIKKTLEKNQLTDRFILTAITPNIHEKINNLYYWSFKIKMKLEKPLIVTRADIKIRNQILKLLPNDFYIDVDPI